MIPSANAPWPGPSVTFTQVSIQKLKQVQATIHPASAKAAAARAGKVEQRGADLSREQQTDAV